MQGPLKGTCILCLQLLTKAKRGRGSKSQKTGAIGSRRFHRNAFKPEQAKGVETYTYLNPGAKAKGLAEKIQAALVEYLTKYGFKREVEGL